MSKKKIWFLNKLVLILIGLIFCHTIGCWAVYPGDKDGSRFFNPSFDISEEYDDNIFASNQNKIGDFSVLLSPGLSLKSISESSFFKLNYGLNIRHFQKYSEIKERGHLFGLQLDHDFSPRLSIGIDNVFKEIIGRADIENGIIVQKDSRLSSDNFLMNVGYRVSEKINLVLLSNSLLTDSNDTKLVESLSHLRRSFVLNIDYQMSQSDKGLFSYEYQQVYFDEGRRDSKANIAGIRLDHQFSDNLSGEFHVGFQSKDFFEIPKKENNTFVNTRLVTELSEKNKFELGYKYEIRDSVRAEFLDQKIKQIFAGLRHSFSSTADICFRYTNDNYNYGDSQRQGLVSMKEHFTVFEVLLHKELTSYLVFEIGFNKSALNSDLGFSRSRAFTSIKTEF